LHTDSNKRNVLHHAVIKKNKEIVKKLITLDSDHLSLRKQEDSKSRHPQFYDNASLYSQIFMTVWDLAAIGSLTKLKFVYREQQKTHWLGNTPLHLAVKGQ